MKLTVQRFRLLVLAIAASWILTVLLEVPTLGQQWSEYSSAGYSRVVVAVTYAFVLSLYALFAAMIIGLYRLRPYGRACGLLLVAFAVLQAAFVDFNDEAGLASVLFTAGGYLMIAVLAAAYWVPAVSERFESRR